MSTSLTQLQQYTDALLQIDQFDDYCPNGLQIEGKPDIDTLVCGVTASQALIEAALDLNADALLVHHGYFWRGEDPRITGIKGRRIKQLIQAGVSLLAYHLPLDAHAEFGNNAQLGKRLGVKTTGDLFPGAVSQVGSIGTIETTSAKAFAETVATALGRKPLLVEADNTEITRIAWCTGGAQGYIDQAADQGADLYLTGEVSEQTVHIARERGIHFIAAGHHATERYGAMAIGEHLAEHFGLNQSFIDIDNPA